MIESRFLRRDHESRFLCSIGSAILGVVGVGAEIAAYAGPVLTAGIGAGVSAATGNDPLTGALAGGAAGVVGAIPGLGIGEASTLGENAFNFGSIGALNAAAGTPGAGGSLDAGAAGIGSPVGATTAPAAGAAPGGAPVDSVMQSNIDLEAQNAAGKGMFGDSFKGGVTGGASAAGKAATDVATKGAGGIDKSSLILGGLAAGAQLLARQPQQSAQQQVTGATNVQKALTEAQKQAQGPMWNQPLPTNYGPSRIASVPANFDPYTAGFKASPSYFGDNRLTFPTWPTQAAHGGAIGALNAETQGDEEFSTARGQHYVRGPGDGQSDEVPAQLSDGEYVLTAHDVAVLGGGSNEAGARKLDQWRDQLHRTVGGDKIIPKRAVGALNQLHPGQG